MPCAPVWYVRIIIAYSIQTATSISNFFFFCENKNSIKRHRRILKTISWFYACYWSIYKWVCFCGYFLVNVVVRKVNPYLLVLSVNTMYYFPFHNYSYSHVIKMLLSVNISCNTESIFNWRTFLFVLCSFLNAFVYNFKYLVTFEVYNNYKDVRVNFQEIFQLVECRSRLVASISRSVARNF